MNRLLAWIGGALGAWRGWRVGMPIGIMVAYLLSLVGLGIGLHPGETGLSLLPQ